MKLEKNNTGKKLNEIYIVAIETVECWIHNLGVPCSKPLGGPKVDSAVHPSEVDKMSTRDFRELNGKK